MKTRARKHPWYIRWYQRLVTRLEKLIPFTGEYEDAKPWEMQWEPFTRHRCEHCFWVKMDMNEMTYRWQCDHCMQRYQTDVPVTVKRPAIKLSTDPETPPHVEVPKPAIVEQRAIQPWHVFTLQQPVPYAPGMFRSKLKTGEIIMINGKPCYKNGVRVPPEELVAHGMITLPQNRRTG